MLAKHWSVVILVAALTVANWAWAQEGVRWQPNLEAGKRLAAQTNRLVLVHFWTESCGPCMKMEREVFSRPDVAAAIEANYVPVRINVRHFPLTARQYGVAAWPTDLVITPQGDIVAHRTGGLDAAQYVATINQIAARWRSGIVTGPPLAAMSASNQIQSLSDHPISGDERGADAGAVGPGHVGPPMDPAIGARASGGNLTQSGQRGPAPESPVASPWQPSGVAPWQVGGGSWPAANPNATPPASPVTSSFPAASSPTRQPSLDWQTQQTTAGWQTQQSPGAWQTQLAPAAQAKAWQPEAGVWNGARPSLNADRQGPGVPLGPPSPTQDGAPPRFAAGAATDTGNHRTDRSATGSAAQAVNAAAPPSGTPGKDTSLAGPPPLGLDGYCPVTLAEQERWVRGDVRYGVIHRGRTYLFAGPEEAKRFYADPDRYAPVLSGIDVVMAVDDNRHVPGRREHGAWYEGRVYLFASEASYRRFADQPARYAAAAMHVASTAVGPRTSPGQPIPPSDRPAPSFPVNSAPIRY